MRYQYLWKYYATLFCLILVRTLHCDLSCMVTKEVVDIAHNQIEIWTIIKTQKVVSICKMGNLQDRGNFRS